VRAHDDASVRGRIANVSANVRVGHVRDLRWGGYPALRQLRDANANVQRWDLERMVDLLGRGRLRAEHHSVVRSGRDRDVQLHLSVGQLLVRGRGFAILRELQHWNREPDVQQWDVVDLVDVHGRRTLCAERDAVVRSGRAANVRRDVPVGDVLLRGR
jgi:hypothetical protein